MDLITGATGNVGSALVARLLADGRRVRVFTRDPQKAARWGGRVEVVEGDFTDPETFARAVDGADGVFLMNVSTGAEAFRRLLAAVKGASVPRTVFLSSLLVNVPGLGIGRLHKEKEDAIREAGLTAAFLRPGAFMSNAGQWAGTIRSEGVVYNPMGAGKVAPIAPEDIAVVAAEALTSPGLAGEVLELTGGELLSVPEEVEILARVLGRPIRCIDIPVEAAVRGLIAAGLPVPLAEAVGQSYEAVRDGRAVERLDTVERVTGRKPRTFETWAREHASRFFA